MFINNKNKNNNDNNNTNTNTNVNNEKNFHLDKSDTYFLPPFPSPLTRGGIVDSLDRPSFKAPLSLYCHASNSSSKFILVSSLFTSLFIASTDDLMRSAIFVLCFLASRALSINCMLRSWTCSVMILARDQSLSLVTSVSFFPSASSLR
mmetsp:Transcript_10120/g.18745  ORF Transcript_10120/g.18745 Transcript_10120/m.18745 type:complete len:149 (+) Transcript_10120:77-523(+)